MQGTNGVAGIHCGARTLGEMMKCYRAGNVFSNEVHWLQMCPHSNGTCIVLNEFRCYTAAANIITSVLIIVTLLSALSKRRQSRPEGTELMGLILLGMYWHASGNGSRDAKPKQSHRLHDSRASSHGIPCRRHGKRPSVWVSLPLPCLISVLA